METLGDYEIEERKLKDPQIIFGCKDQPDYATLQVFPTTAEDATSDNAAEAGNIICASDTKFSPIDGSPVSPTSEARMVESFETVTASLVPIGTCKCKQRHFADIATTSAMIEQEIEAFYCTACSTQIDLDVNLPRYLELSSATKTGDASCDASDGAEVNADAQEITENMAKNPEDADTASEIDIASLTQEEFDAYLDTLTDEASAEFGDTLDYDEASLTDVADGDSDEGDGESSDDDKPAGKDEDTITVDDTDDSDANGDDAPAADATSTDTKADAPAATDVKSDAPAADAPAADATKSDGDKPADKPAEDVKPDASADKTDIKSDADKDDKKKDEDTKDDASLFTHKDENEEGKTFAEVINGVKAEGGDSDTARIIPFTPLNAQDDLAFVLNAAKTRYIVFANERPAGMLLRDNAKAANVELFEKSVFTQAFAHQLAQGLDTSAFGYVPYGIKIDTAELLAERSAKEREDTAAAISADYNDRIVTLRESLHTVATAINKGVWKQRQNPIRETLVASLLSLGFEDAAHVVDRAFTARSAEYVETLLAQAIELSAKPREIRETQRELVDAASYYVSPTTEDFAAKLSNLGKIEEVKPAMKVDTAATVSDKKFDWKNAW